jgi:biopolymer transport protein ExbD
MLPRRRRPLTRPQPGAAQSDINVTPLVDVVLVLLIIFMVLTPLQQKALHLLLPETEASDPQPPQPAAAAQLVVTLDAHGALALDGAPLPLAALGEALRARLPGRSREERVVFFTASPEAPYPALVEAMDAARRAEPGVEVAMATEVPVPGAR